MDPLRHLKISIAILALVAAAGTAGYMLLENWPFLDALYMTVITLGTVGFSEVHKLDAPGRVLTIALITLGVGVIGYIVSSLAQLMFEGQIQKVLGRKKVEKAIEALENHYIICGFGRIGALVCRELAAKPLPFVVVEREEAAIARHEASGTDYLFVHGDATQDESLNRAGIKKAKGLISVVASDTENVYITLTARGLNPELFILARSGEDGSDLKLKRAGANKVISPYLIGGSRIAQAILRPNVVDFIEIATGHEHMELQMEELVIAAASPVVGKTLADAGFHQKSKTMVIGIKKNNGKMIFNPEMHTNIAAGDALIVLGEPLAIQTLERLLLQ